MRAFGNWPPATSLAALGVLSGSLSAWFQGPSFGDDPGAYMILAGVWFALVVASGIWLWGAHTLVAVVLGFVGSWVAWELAVNLAVHLDQRWFNRLPEFSAMALSGIAAGALGALVTWAGAAASDSRLREPSLVGYLVGAGAVLGALLAPATHFDHPALLFVPWQAAVAFILGAALDHPAPVPDIAEAKV